MQTCLRLGLTVSDEILYYNTLFTDQLRRIKKRTDVNNLMGAVNSNIFFKKYGIARFLHGITHKAMQQ